MIKKCLFCGKEFIAYDCLIKIGKGKYCSKNCASRGIIHKPNSGCFIKGEHRSPDTEFKKGEFLGKNHPLWKGGRYKTSNGYIMCYVPNHPRAYGNYVLEHTLVVEKKIGRHLLSNESCHHLNGIKDDNRPENLVICQTHAEHFLNHRRYRRYNKKNAPAPHQLGEKIAIRWSGKKVAIHESSVCKKCNKLFWKDVCKDTKFCSRGCIDTKPSHYRFIDMVEVLHKHRLLGKSIIEIAKEYNISFCTLYRKIKKYEFQDNPRLSS